MAKWRFTRTPGTFDYPFVRLFGVKASDVIESNTALDEYWEQVPDETPATRTRLSEVTGPSDVATFDYRPLTDRLGGFSSQWSGADELRGPGVVNYNPGTFVPLMNSGCFEVLRNIDLTPFYGLDANGNRQTGTALRVTRSGLYQMSAIVSGTIDTGCVITLDAFPGDWNVSEGQPAVGGLSFAIVGLPGSAEEGQQSFAEGMQTFQKGTYIVAGLSVNDVPNPSGTPGLMFTAVSLVLDTA